jgi:anti-sigma B factor antagonist
MSLVLKTSVTGGNLIVTVLVSRLDAAIAREFKAGVEAAWTSGLNKVEIDLDAVEFVDSSGIGALLSVYRKLPPGVGVTRLTKVKPGVLAVLELLRLHRVFELGA